MCVEVWRGDFENNSNNLDYKRLGFTLNPVVGLFLLAVEFK